MQKHPINSFLGAGGAGRGKYCGSGEGGRWVGGGGSVGRGRGVGGSGAAHQVRGQRKAKKSSVIPCQSFQSLIVLQTALILANRYISLLMK